MYVPSPAVVVSVPVNPETASTQIPPSGAPPEAAVTFPVISPPTTRDASTLGVGVVPAVTVTAVASDSVVWPLYHWAR